VSGGGMMVFTVNIGYSVEEVQVVFWADLLIFHYILTKNY
jgi:hypothetical protein